VGTDRQNEDLRSAVEDRKRASGLSTSLCLSESANLLIIIKNGMFPQPYLKDEDRFTEKRNLPKAEEAATKAQRLKVKCLDRY
jgi:hypothetical protein